MYLYVMGRAHCGSTILGIVLGGGAAISSVGELVSGLERYAGGEPCSCGALMHECPFWTDVRRRFEAEGFGWDELARRSRDQTDVRSWPATRLAGPNDPDRTRLAALTRALLRAATGASGKPHLLDSNKETTRGLFLLKYLPEARVIHLVRDPRTVQQSYYWRLRAGRGFHFRRRKLGVGRTTAPLLVLLGALSWAVGSVLGELAVRAAPGRALRLRYEDFCRDPAAAVRAIGATFGLEVGDVAAGLERGEAFRVGHNVGGNHIRHHREVRFDAGTEATRPPLPRWAELVTLLICWPLMLYYGYPLAAPRPGAKHPGRAEALSQG